MFTEVLTSIKSDEIKASVAQVKENLDRIDNQVAFGGTEMGDLEDSVWSLVKALLEGKN